jgi:hypothetical protein
MSKCGKVGGCGCANAAVGFVGNRGWASRHSEVPQAGGGSAMALKDRCVIVPDGCRGEGDIVQPASHNCPMERREWDAKSGTIWTFWAAGGRPGTSSSASWVECMMEPSGLRMLMGSSVGRWLMTGELAGAEKIAGASSVSDDRGDWLRQTYKRVG